MIKIKVIETGDIIEVAAPYMEVKNGFLYNNNSGKMEAVGGDIVKVRDREYHILKGQYTDSQVLPCEEAENEYRCVILDANNELPERVIRHKSQVCLVD